MPGLRGSARPLHAALGNRDVIGQAKGILTERHRITAEVAFGYLSVSSQSVNMRLTTASRYSSTPVSC